VEARILERDSEIAELLVGVRRIAVLGMKTEAQAGQPAFYVPEYLARVGYDPVYAHAFVRNTILWTINGRGPLTPWNDPPAATMPAWVTTSKTTTAPTP